MSTIRNNNTVYNQIIRPMERTLMFVAREAGEYAANDPALALRFTATNLVPPIMQGVNPEVAEATEHTIVPVMRAGLLAVNAARAVKTFQDPNSTGFEKGMDVMRVASDLVGFAGGVTMLFMPQYASLGAKMMGAAYSVDIVSHAFRGLTHANRRIKVWQAEQAANEQKPDNKPDKPDGGNNPPAPPAPPLPPQGPGKTLTVFEQPRPLDLFNTRA